MNDDPTDHSGNSSPDAHVEPSTDSTRDAVTVADPPTTEASSVAEAEAEPRVAPRRRRRPRVSTVILSIALLLATGAAATGVVLVLQALERIDELEQINEDQKELIDEKETFGAAMNELMDTASALDGSLFGSLVPLDRYQSLADRAWKHRWTASTVQFDTGAVQSEIAGLRALIDAAALQAASNSTGSVHERVLDSLSAGYVTTTFDDVDALCQSDVLACVTSDDPFTVHVDGADSALPYMNDWIETGIAYHEFAHVLQYANPEATDTAVAAFGGDFETMADCFALTYLPGWTLDHRVWVSSYEYWDVNIGYGYACDASQADVVRTWYSELVVTVEPITQS